MARWRRVRIVLVVVVAIAGVAVPAAAQGPTCDNPPPTCDRILDVAEPLGAAIAQSQRDFVGGGAAYVVLGRDDAFPDNLAATALAGAAAPLLYTRGGPGRPLPPEVLDEIGRVLGGPSGTTCDATNAEVFIVGSTNAVSALAEDTLRGQGYCTHRFGGASRFETAELIAGEVRRRTGSTEVVIARADDWADAATAGAWAASAGVPIVITSTATLHASVARFLEQGGFTRVIIVGGTAAVSDTVENQVRSQFGYPLTRVFGAARDLTAIAIYQQLWGTNPAPTGFQIVNGYVDIGWAYAFAAAPNAAQRRYPQLLTTTDSLPQSTIDVLIATRPLVVTGVGPTTVVSDQTIDDAGTAAQGGQPGGGGTSDLRESGELTLPGASSACGLAWEGTSGLIVVAECADPRRLKVYDAQQTLVADYPIPIPGDSATIDLDFVTYRGSAYAGTIPEEGLLMGLDAGMGFYLDVGTGQVLSTFEVPAEAAIVGAAWAGATAELIELTADPDAVTRIDAASLQANSTFFVPDPGPGADFDVTFGDVEVACDQNLWMVSGAEDVLMETDGAGAFVELHEIDGWTGDPSRGTPTSLAFNDATGQALIGYRQGAVVSVVDGFGWGTCPGAGPPSGPPTGGGGAALSVAETVTIDADGRGVCGLAFDDAPDTDGPFFGYLCNDPAIRTYARDGTTKGADDWSTIVGQTLTVGLDLVPSATTFGGQAVSAGDLMFLLDSPFSPDLDGLAPLVPPDGFPRHRTVAGPDGVATGAAWDATTEEMVTVTYDDNSVKRVDPDTRATTSTVALTNVDLAENAAVEVGCNGDVYIVTEEDPNLIRLPAGGGPPELMTISGEDEAASQNHSAIAIDNATGEVWIGLHQHDRLLRIEGLDPGTCPRDPTPPGPSQAGVTPDLFVGHATWSSSAGDYDDQIGTRVAYECPSGGSARTVYGTDTYVDDSSVCTAAVHFGLISFTHGGQVVFEMVSTTDAYEGTTRHGVTTNPYSGANSSFFFPTS